jgi:tetratricopeptide (TPR) repeat protein
MKKCVFILIAFLIFFCKSAYPSIQIEDNIFNDEFNAIPKALEKDLETQKIITKKESKIEEKIKIKEEPQIEGYALYNSNGKYFYKIKEYQNALEEFKMAVELKKDFAEGYNNIGLSYFRLGKLDEALEEFKKAIKYDPFYFEAYNNLGSAYLDLGDYENAITYFKKAKSYYSDSEQVNANLKQALELKKKRTINFLILFACMIAALIYLLVKVFSGRKNRVENL